VAQHDRPEDAWVVVKGKVYDVSSWGSSHPGGNVLYSFAGKVWRWKRSILVQSSLTQPRQDATDVFSAFHSPAAWKWLQPLQVGLLSGAPAELLADFRKLRSEMQASGLFNSSKAYYVMKVRSSAAVGSHSSLSLCMQCTSNLAICALSLTVLAYNKSFPAIIFASFLMVSLCATYASDKLRSPRSPSGAVLAAVRLARARFLAPPGVQKPLAQQRGWPVFREPEPGVVLC
jgi:Cytochrome b5-like Heme/Steroid binding domain